MRAGLAPVELPSRTVGVPPTMVARKPPLGRVYRH